MTFQKRFHLTGFQTFLLIWFGQMISMIGTAMTRFALLTWAYQQTGEATTLALLGFFSFGTYALVSPIAGVWVDRWDRRRVLLISDMGAGVVSLAVLGLYLAGGLSIWHLYVAEMLLGVADAFFIPAYGASISLLVPKAQYARANGMRSLGFSMSRVVAPFLAGLLLALIDLRAVLLVDIATFLVAVTITFLMYIPAPQQSAESQAVKGSFRKELAFGFRYIFARPGLLYLMLIVSGTYFAASLTYHGVMPAMILARTGGNELALAAVQSTLGIAGVAGGLAISVWGGPKKRIHGVLAYCAASFLLGDFFMGIGQGVAVWCFAAVVTELFVPILISSDRTIWQSKVPPDAQGRVFAVLALFREGTIPFGFLVAGPLADHVFGPAMMPGGALAPIFGGLVGTGAGAGMGLMFVCTAIIGTTISLSGYLIPAVRNVEADYPDHDVPEKVAAAEHEVLPLEAVLAEGTA